MDDLQLTLRPTINYIPFNYICHNPQDSITSADMKIISEVYIL